MLPASPDPDPAWAGVSVLFPTIENPAFYGNQTVNGYGGRVNNVSGGVYDPLARVPMVSLPWLFHKFGQLSGWTFGGRLLTDPDLTRLLLYNLTSLDGAASLYYQNHLPDLTMAGLIVSLRQLFNLYLEFDVRRKRMTADLADDVLTADIELDWSDKVVPSHVKTPDLLNRLELSYLIDSNDALMKPVPAPFDKYTTAETDRTAGGSVLPIKSAFSTLLTNPATGLAMTAQPGQSVTNKDNPARPTPKLLFWNGMVGGIPTATNSRNGKALTWTGAGNLKDTYWAHYEAFKARTFGISQSVVLTAADLAGFRFRRKVHIRGVNYLVESYKAALGANDQVIPAELKLWKV